MAYQTFTVNQQLTSTQMNTLQESVFITPKNQQSGTTYTLLATDAGKLLEFTNNGAITLTIPTAASVAFDIGTSISILKAGTGTVTLVGSSGVTVNSLNTDNTVSKQWEIGILTKRDSDGWVLSSFEDVIDSSVTTAKIAALAVTAAKIASDAVTTAKILDANVTDAKLASDSVTTVKILDSNVTTAKIADGAVTQAKLATGTPQAGFRSVQNAATITSSNYTIQLTDLGKLVEIDNATACTLTVPTNASVAFSVGDRIDVLQIGAGQVTITPVSGTVTINGYDGGLLLNGQWAAATLIKRATNTWVAVGNLTT